MQSLGPWEDWICVLIVFHFLYGIHVTGREILLYFLADSNDKSGVVLQHQMNILTHIDDESDDRWELIVGGIVISRGKPNYSNRILPQYHSVHHKFIECLRIEPKSLWWEASTCLPELPYTLFHTNFIVSTVFSFHHFLFYKQENLLQVLV
jgi:hypothetical protein